MNLEKLDEIMNCNCLQNIIKNDQNKYNSEHEMLGKKYIFTPNSNGIVIFECITEYRSKIIDSNTNRVEKNVGQTDNCGIPFIYCPICGKKTKTDVPEESFYHDLKNKKIDINNK